MKTLKKSMTLAIIITIVISQGCKKIIEVDLPIDKISSESVYGNVNTAVAAINSVYADLADGPSVKPLAIDLGLASDELKTIFPDPDYQNNFTDPSSSVFSIWTGFYGSGIYRLNSVIEGVSKSKEISDLNKKTIIGEAKFTRGFLYFYLVNLYGDVPLVLSTDFKTNSNIGRSTTTAVYQQIILDLTEAVESLPNRYLTADLSSATIDRVRPTKAAAYAMLARVYLYLGKWDSAEQAATAVIENPMFQLSDINEVFKKNSSETIWALQPNFQSVGGQANNTQEGIAFNSLFGNTPSIQITTDLLNSFEISDHRKTEWINFTTNAGINYYYPFKYRVGGPIDQNVQQQEEYSIVLRLSEQYLIRAEARAHLNLSNGLRNAKDDLDVIRLRAGLSETSATGLGAMLTAIWHERQVELFAEWGAYRWLDLKRTGLIDNVMTRITDSKGGVWQPYKALLPIPYSEILTNPALVGHQNPGYPERL